jgi:hypothetical protein
MKAPRDGWDPDEIDALKGFQREVESLRKQHEDDPPGALLRAAQHDALPSELQDDARAYLSTHAWSRALVEGLDAAEPSLPQADQDRLLARIQKAATQTRESQPRAAWWLRPALVASAFAVLVLGVWIWRGASVTPPQDSGAAPASETAANPAPPTQARETTSPGSPGPPASPAGNWTLPLEKPQLMLTAVALTWRGPGVGSQLLPDMKPAVDAFRKNNYALADREFGALELRYPDAIEVFFFGGVSRLFVSDPERALVALKRAEAIGDATFAPHVAWYLAVADERAGHVPEARAQLDKVCRGASDRATRACAALKEMVGR